MAWVGLLVLLAAGLCDVRASTDVELVDDLEHRTFAWFWETTNPLNGLAPDRGPPASASSIAATGFALTAYPVGVERGWLPREQAAARVVATLRFLSALPQGTAAVGVGGYRGFFYHFLDLSSGMRASSDVELSTIDTAWLMMGVLCCQSYFERPDPAEEEIRTLAEALYRRVEWDWMIVRAPRLCMGWKPASGFLPYDYTGYDEAMALYLLALGSPTHAIGDTAWAAYTSTYAWATWQGQEHVNFGPMFGHQFSHAWVDFRGIADSYMRGRGIDYQENSRRAAYAQRAYAIANPGGWTGYSANVWGLTACDGPADVSLYVGPQLRRFFAYTARGAASNYGVDDGTIAPTAAASAVAYAPEIAIPAIREMRDRYGSAIYDAYGFVDAFNPTFTATAVPLQMGRVVPGIGWVDTQHLGIDQGPILLGAENSRSGLVWRIMRRNSHVVAGLRRAGFSGGWLDAAPTILEPPRATAADVGTGFSLHVDADGVGPLVYQWLKDGLAIDGATASIFAEGSAGAEAAGLYSVEVRNENGATTSPAVRVEVHARPASLINLSARGFVGAGDAALIPGFSCAGDRASPILVRVVGPSLAALGVPAGSLLSDPRLALRRLDGFELGANDDWAAAGSDATALAAAMAQVGAFPLPEASRDAALLCDAQPGVPLTVVSTGAEPGTGIALAEIYARDDAADARLVNLSARAFVGLGDDVLIPGFYLSRGGTRRLLLRAVGPSLQTIAPALGPLLADPILVVHRAPGGAVLEVNDDWQASTDAAAIRDAAARVGAFPLSDASKDAALILTVGPSVSGVEDRGFTLEVRGADGGIGIALAEVYELPDE